MVHMFIERNDTVIIVIEAYLDGALECELLQPHAALNTDDSFSSSIRQNEHTACTSSAKTIPLHICNTHGRRAIGEIVVLLDSTLGCDDHLTLHRT